jgi:hypothetical protein
MDILVADGSIRVIVRLCAAIKEAGCRVVRAELTLHPADLFDLLCNPLSGNSSLAFKDLQNVAQDTVHNFTANDPLHELSGFLPRRLITGNKNCLGFMT